MRQLTLFAAAAALAVASLGCCPKCRGAEPPSVKVETIATTGPATLGSSPTVLPLRAVPCEVAAHTHAPPAAGVKAKCPCGPDCPCGDSCGCAVSYAAAVREAAAAGKLVAVFVGRTPRPVAGCVSCRAELGGAWGTKPIVCVGRPVTGGAGYDHPADADDDRLRQTVTFLTAPPAVVYQRMPVGPPVYQPPFRERINYWFGGNCPNGRCQ